MTEVRDGPFVVFTPERNAAPGLFATLSVVSALGGVIARNLLLFVAVPGTVLVGGLAAIRRLVDPTVPRNPTRLGGGIVVAGGARRPTPSTGTAQEPKQHGRNT